MAEYKTLSEAMDADDQLAEALLRYRLLSESFEASPQLRGNLNPALERTKAAIMQLRSAAAAVPQANSDDGKVVAFDANRFRKSAGGDC